MVNGFNGLGLDSIKEIHLTGGVTGQTVKEIDRTKYDFNTETQEWELIKKEEKLPM